MSGHAYFGQNLTKIRHAYVFDNGEYKKLRKAWYYDNGEFKQVWSGASEVSYYDGDTLLGMREVDEGEDVLRPDLDMTKSGYTHVGWKQAVYGDKVLELNATGEPMVLYAMYLPNTYNAVSDSTYVTGATAVSHAETPYYTGHQSWDITKSFVLNMREYQNNSITVVERNLYSGGIDDYAPWGYGEFDGNNVPKNSSRTYTNISNGTHTLRTIGQTVDEQVHVNTQETRLYVSSLILSNPTPWT